MLNENIRKLRKSKGLTQEDLASRLHVVRQTVSKWEKGLSVPDADTLQTLAETLDCEVSQLLGADIPDATNVNDVANQLASINEQLAIRNNRSRRIWKIIGIAALVYVCIQALFLIVACSAASCFAFHTDVSVTDEAIEYISDSDAEEVFEYYE